nr:unnamed protein product [Digitaria exilis]
MLPLRILKPSPKKNDETRLPLPTRLRGSATGIQVRTESMPYTGRLRRRREDLRPLFVDPATKPAAGGLTGGAHPSAPQQQLQSSQPNTLYRSPSPTLPPLPLSHRHVGPAVIPNLPAAAAPFLDVRSMPRHPVLAYLMRRRALPQPRAPSPLLPLLRVVPPPREAVAGAVLRRFAALEPHREHPICRSWRPSATGGAPSALKSKPPAAVSDSGRHCSSRRMVSIFLRFPLYHRIAGVPHEQSRPSSYPPWLLLELLQKSPCSSCL